MNARLFTVVILTASLVLILTWAVFAQEAEPKPSDVRAPTAGASVILNLNLGSDALAIDPALITSIDGSSLFVANQLFLGLVRVNDETGEIIPELASSWEMSADATVFTFTLRSDVTWTDGNPVTAYDVRYGILRSLDPATGAGWAYSLFVFQNASEYNEGSITDPNQVGVTALDNTHIRFDLTEAAAYLPSILALPVARAMPEWAISAHPADWTEPANIVTNGPYKLMTWVHDISMTLEKNAGYYDVANVQIGHVLFSMVDDTTAWGMYQAGQLDSAIVPQEQWNAARGDPLLRQELHAAPMPCTYYYGFNTAQEPFDDVQVRKAFIAAVNRQGVIDNAIGYAQQPAPTFTPPSIFGHVDGYAEGVGILHNPAQAQQWLADAGYPNGQGLPEITLMYNTSTGHQAIAESVRQNWIDNLAVTVALSDTVWSDYLDLLVTDPPQVWRLGWCRDHDDAYNFLYDGVVPSRVSYGNWSNAVYDSLLSQAAQTADPSTRKSLYKQAEEILVETDAVMLPIYYYGNGMATKPYLERTYGNTGFGGYIAEWRITRVSEVIGTDGGDLTSYDGSTTVQIPGGAVTSTVVISHTPAFGMPPSGNLNSIGNVFDITAVYSSTDPGIAGLPAQIAPGYTYTITAEYSDTEIDPTVEDTLSLYGWDEGTSHWSQQGITSSVDITDNLVTAQVDHFSLFAVLFQEPRPTPEPLYLSLANGGSYTVGSVTKVRDEDILSFDGLDFEMVFDGSDVGVGSLDLDAFFVVDGNTILMSFNKAATIGSLGLVDDSDLVEFEASSLGKNTAGSFSLYFDGSDVGLETNGEDVDGVTLLPDGDLLLSTVGNPSVPGVSGKDEDVLRFSPTSLGEVTGGSWSMYFDGSDVGLNTSAGEDLDGLALAGNGDLYLTTAGSFSVSGVSGEDEDVFVCTPTSLGDTTACTFSSTLLFDGSAWGLADNDVDAISLPPELLFLSLANSGSYTVGSATRVRDEDILSFDGADFAMVFDGSDVGVGSLDLDAFFLVDGNTILMSFDKAASIGSLGLVDDSDLVQFEASSLGKNTAGSFSLYFDGSDVGLETNSEDVDAVMLLPDGDLLLSTVGNPSVPGVSGKDEDVLRFSPTSLGEVTGGSWSMYFDGSDVGLNTSAGEDLDGLAVAGNGDLYLTSRGSFSVSGISGEDEDVFVCTPTSLGDNTACTFSSTLLFDGSAWGLTDNDLDAISSNG